MVCSPAGWGQHHYLAQGSKAWGSHWKGLSHWLPQVGLPARWPCLLSHGLLASVFPSVKWDSTVSFASHCPLIPAAPSCHHIAVMYPHPPALRFLSCSDSRPHLLSDPHHQDPCRAQGRSAYGLPHEHWLLPARREPLTGLGVQLRKAHVASRGQLKVTPNSLQVLCKGP